MNDSHETMTDLPQNHLMIERAKALAFAAHSAIGQLRKFNGEPYFNHVKRVADLVSTCPDVMPEMIAAAYLHDTVEDTKVTLDDIQENFGLTVSMMVYWLTNISKPEDGNRAVRVAIDRDHIALAPPNVKTIKFADLIDNTSTIIKYAPDFAKIYIPEKRALLEVLTEGDPELYAMAVQQVADAERQLMEMA